MEIATVTPFPRNGMNSLAPRLSQRYQPEKTAPVRTSSFSRHTSHCERSVAISPSNTTTRDRDELMKIATVTPFPRNGRYPLALGLLQRRQPEGTALIPTWSCSGRISHCERSVAISPSNTTTRYRDDLMEIATVTPFPRNGMNSLAPRLSQRYQLEKTAPVRTSSFSGHIFHCERSVAISPSITITRYHDGLMEIATVTTLPRNGMNSLALRLHQCRQPV